MICKTCLATATSLANDECIPCHNISTAAWQKRMAIRQNPVNFHMGTLINLLLTQHWMHECRIVPDYMPPHPRPDTRPICEVSYLYEDGTESCLRHSAGPLQGYFWDTYGDDMHSPELALIALSKAPAPPRVHAVISTHGR